MNEAEYRKTKKKIVVPFVILCVLVLVAAAAIGVYSYKYTFTRAKWNNYSVERYKLVGSLTSKYELVGMTEEQVTKLLGDEYRNAPTSFKISDEYLLMCDKEVIEV